MVLHLFLQLPSSRQLLLLVLWGKTAAVVLQLGQGCRVLQRVWWTCQLSYHTPQALLLAPPISPHPSLHPCRCGPLCLEGRAGEWRGGRARVRGGMLLPVTPVCVVFALRCLLVT